MRDLPLLYTGGGASGKTCAIAGLYGALLEGIPLAAPNPGLLRLTPEAPNGKPVPEGDWVRLTREGRLPPSRPGAALYGGTLCRDQDPLCRLRLLDYPNGALMEEDLLTRTPPEDPADCAKDPDDSLSDPYGELDSFFEDGASGAGAFLNLLAKTPALVYVLPGELLALDRQLEWMEAHHRTGTAEYRLAALEVTESIGLLRSVMNRVQTLRTDRPPLILYITKADQLQTGVTITWAAKRIIQRRYLFFPGTEVLACGSTLGPEVRTDASGRIAQGLAPRGFALPLLLVLGRFLSRCSVLDARDLFEQIRRDELCKFYKDPYSYVMGQISLTALGLRELQDQYILRRARQKTAAWSAANGIARYLKDCGEEILYFNQERQERPIREFFALDGCGS